jgi:hypothetical protein
MLSLEFPYTIGFTYFEEEDEWRTPTYDGKLILWEKPDKRDFWVLSYHDKDDYLHTITSGYPDEINSGIKAFYRDKKISELISD